MTEEELKAIEARVQAATPGPWYAIHTDDEAFQTATYVGLDPRGTLVGPREYSDGTRHKKRIMEGGVSYERVVAITCLQMPLLTLLDESEENTRFVAHAREDIPALIAEIRRLNGLLKNQG